jgi:chemotaxis protein methyltransferase CheR
MSSAEFAAFFGDVSAALGLCEAGYRRTRGSVEKRLRRRMHELGLTGLGGYRAYLDVHPEEWTWLDACCRITISRFWRDAAVFDQMAAALLPERAAAAQARGQERLRLWSAGCASGEEAYSLALATRFDVEPSRSDLGLEVLGTDADPVVLGRARRAAYPVGALRDLPEPVRERAFERRGDEYWLLPPWRAAVHFELADLRRELPEGPFDLICCRNLAFTYFDEPLARRLERSFAELLRPGGVLVVGLGEELPGGSSDLTLREPCVYARATDST